MVSKLPNFVLDGSNEPIRTWARANYGPRIGIQRTKFSKVSGLLDPST